MTSDALDQAARRWRHAEAALYPIVMVRPDLYERSVLIVRDAVAELRSATTFDALLDADMRGEDIVTAAAARLGVPLTELDVGHIAGAAFAQRHREISAGIAEAQRRERIAAARRRGDAWLVLNESGSREHPVYGEGYHRLEMRVSDGMGVHAFVDADPETAQPVYGAEVVRLDPETGAWMEGSATADATATTFDSADDWEGHLEQLRRGVDRPVRPRT